jgi:polyisoprenoid-binding protein YceI
MTWELDKVHSEISFSVRHMMITSVRGKFRDFSGKFEGDPANLGGAHAEVTVDAGSVDTADGQRDGHLRSGDFFDAEKHPKITFRSTGVEKRGDKYEVRGDLTIRGVTKPVLLHAEIEGPAKDPWGNQRVGISATGEVDREDYGLVWNQALETGGVLVGKKVKLAVEIELIAK